MKCNSAICVLPLEYRQLKKSGFLFAYLICKSSLNRLKRGFREYFTIFLVQYMNDFSTLMVFL